MATRWPPADAGCPWKGIRVSLLGCVTDLPGRLPNPTSAWRIAAAGPAVTLLLGAVFYGVALLADSGGATLIGMSATWLAYSNLAIGALNLLPGAPFDGGQILCAALWRWSGDQHRAEHLAARAGQALGLILLGAAIVQVVTGGITGIWVGLLGAFMLISASTAVRQGRQLPTADPGRPDDEDDELARHRQIPVVRSGSAARSGVRVSKRVGQRAGAGGGG